MVPNSCSGNAGNRMMTRLGSFDLRAKLAKDLTFTGTYTQTNADEHKHSTALRLDYKTVDMEKVGSWSIYGRYFDYGRYGDFSHDDEWCSLPIDMRGWLLSFRYVPYKNVVWETFYSDQRQNRSGFDAGMQKNAKRHLFRTQLDFHF